jgi:hypothetical protein
MSGQIPYKLPRTFTPPPYQALRDRNSGQVFGQVLCLFRQVFAILKAERNAVKTMT